jgi:hypothetical protein
MEESNSAILIDLKQEKQRKMTLFPSYQLPLHYCTKLVGNLVTNITAVVAATAYAPHDESSGLC